MKLVQNTCLCIALFMAFSNIARGQSEDGLVAWTDFNYTYSFNTSWGVGGDAGFRMAITQPGWSQVYARPILIYRNTDQLYFGLSFGAFQSFDDSHNTLDLRPAQQVNWVWPKFENWSLKSRVRIEEQYLTKTFTDGEISSGWKYRGRYELKFKTEPSDLLFARNIYFLASGEYFFPLEGDRSELLADQSRLLLGYGQKLGPRFSYELDFFWQRVRDELTGAFDSDQFVLRLRVFLRNESFEFTEED